MEVKSKYGLANQSFNQYNAIIGISVGGRIFSKEKIKEITKFALIQHDKVLILLVDSIKKYNWMAFNNMSEKESINKAIREGIEYRKAAENVIKNLEKEKYDTSRISIMNWEEVIEIIPTYNQTLKLLKEFYLSNEVFKYDCLKMTDKYIEKKGILDITLAQKEIAIEFLLNELSLFLLIGTNLHNYCIDIYPGKFPVLENIIDGKYDGLLNKLHSPILYGHIEIEW